MHPGQSKGPQNSQDHAFNTQYQQMSTSNATAAVASTPAVPPESLPNSAAQASSIEELVSGAAEDTDKASVTAKGKAPESKTSEGVEEKKGKKEKDKNMKLVYSDNEVSPEEKMARLPRYAFARST